MKAALSLILILSLSGCTKAYTFKTFSHGEVTYHLPPYGDKKLYYSIARWKDGTIREEKYGVDHKVSTVMHETKGLFETIIEGGHELIP